LNSFLFREKLQATQMQSIKTIQISVPDSFQVPSWYSTATPAKRALAIRLGGEAVAFLQKKGSEWMREETHQEAVVSAAATYQTQLEEMKKNYEEVFTKMRGEKMKMEEILLAAHARLEALQSSASEVRNASQNEAREAMKHILTAKEEQIVQLQSTLERYIEGVVAKMDGLQNTLTKTFSSSKEKGAFGEQLMEGFLKKAYDCSVEVVSKEAQTADIRMIRPNGSQYFWEIKNYTRMISTEELEKFRRDMRLHPDVRGGCLVSLRTGIVGKSRGGDIDIEFLEDGRFILCIGSLMSREDIVFYLQSLRPLFDAVEEFSKPAKEEGATIRELQAKGQLITNLIRSHVQVIAKHKNSIVGHRKRMDTMFTEFQGYVLEAETQLQTLLKVAMGDEEQQEEVQGEVDTLLPAALFRKERLSDYDERQKAFLKWFLGAAEWLQGTEGVQGIELKDLVGKAKTAGFSEKFVRGLREEVFQEEAWPKGTRFLLGVQWLP
jgi:hypothetical protein